MNENLTAGGKNTFSDDTELAGLYCELCSELEQRMGRSAEPSEVVRLTDYVRLERLKRLADADIASRGMGRTETNGRQRYWKDNKSCVLILKYMEQQAKILKALGLTGSETEADGGGDDDAVDDFDSI